MPAKRILILTGDFVEDYEVMSRSRPSPCWGILCTWYAPTRRRETKSKPRFTTSRRPDLHREAGHNYTLNANFSDVQPDAYDAVILPGGRAPEYLRLNERVIQIVRQFAARNKPIAAICHGMQILTAAAS